MRITLPISIVATLLVATIALADPCETGVIGSTVSDGIPVFMVRSECFKAMDLSHELKNTNDRIERALDAENKALRGAIDALTKSSSIAWDAENRIHRKFLQLDADYTASLERIRELAGGRLWRDLTIVGGTLLLVALTAWALDKAQQ